MHRHLPRLVAALSLVALSLAAVAYWAPPVAGQSGPVITLSGTTTTVPHQEYATRVLGDPWDMSQRTDIGWFTWGVDGKSNLTSLGMGVDGKGNTYFTSRTTTDCSAPYYPCYDPNFVLLDTWTPGAVKLGKIGVNHPIDTTVYNALYLKIKFEGEVTRNTMSAMGGVAVAQVFWSRNTIYYDATARPDGGQIRPVTAAPANGDAGLYLTPLLYGPKGGIEGGNWVIYKIPLTLAAMKANNSVIDHWQNIFPGASANWGDSGVFADSLRIDPYQMNIGSQLGEMQVDWARLVAETPGNATTISWTGGGTYDIVVSKQPDCSDFAVVAYSATTGYQLQTQALEPGTYWVGLRLPFTQTGHTAPTGSTLSACSASSFAVRSLPSLTMTSPNPEGSADDYATTFLGNAWDFDALTDIDFSLNATTPDANYGIVSMPATDPAGTDLGYVRVFRNRSAPDPYVGDPHIYTLWPILAQTGARARGVFNRIDASRYRIFTTEASVERTRDLQAGSIARIMWHVADDKYADDTLAVIQSADIALHHLDPATQNGGKIVLEKIQADMADRWSLGLETDIAQSASGWHNTCVASTVSHCDITTASKPGIDMFRYDFHEFPTATDSDIRRIKLAALERTGSAFQIQWTPSNPSSLASTVTLKAVPENNPAGGDYRPADRTCTSPSSITIASGIAIGDGSYTWNPGSTAGLTAGGEYFVCAQISVGGIGVVGETLSKWPVVIDTSYTGPKPTLRLDKTTVRLAGVHNGHTSNMFSSKTPDETIRFVQNGAGTVNWTVGVKDTNGATSNWVAPSPTAGTGPGTFTIGLHDDPTLPSCSPLNGLAAIVTLSSPDIGNSPQYVQVFVTIYPGATAWPGPDCTFPVGQTLAPWGQVDAPAQNAAGIVGAIGVSGWALDDVGVDKVEIYRNLPAFEDPSHCKEVVSGGSCVVYVGKATLVAGARPDVETLYSDRPLAYRAGWGFQVLTNMLPHVPNSALFGGQGMFTFYPYATDMEGHVTLLGRSTQDSTPTTISVANDTIAKPFGAIDTPGQGDTVSGTITNFGWALTPDSGTTPLPGSIMIPTDGSTMKVYIDGQFVAQVHANQCRDGVNNPVPAGVYCTDDVSNIFGNLTPQLPLSPRTSNPTKFRNLDAGRAAIAWYTFDSTTLANGVHTIAWGVTDNNGRADGIGSRYFTVSNGTADVMALADAPAVVIGAEASVSGLPVDSDPVWGRTSFDTNRPWQAVEPGVGGARNARISSSGRLELYLGEGVDAGYLTANGSLRPLPVGSQLRDGYFTWAPGPAYFGEYRLVFVRQGRQVPVTVSIRDTPAREDLEGFIDQAGPDAGTRGKLGVTGWAADPAAWTGTAAGAVQVWATRRDAPAAPVYLGTATLREAPPDGEPAQGRQFGRAAWSLDAEGLASGTYEVTAYFWNQRTKRYEDTRTVTVKVK